MSNEIERKIREFGGWSVASTSCHDDYGWWVVGFETPDEHIQFSLNTGGDPKNLFPSISRVFREEMETASIRNEEDSGRKHSLHSIYAISTDDGPRIWLRFFHGLDSDFGNDGSASFQEVGLEEAVILLGDMMFDGSIPVYLAPIGF